MLTVLLVVVLGVANHTLCGCFKRFNVFVGGAGSSLCMFSVFNFLTDTCFS